LLALVAPLRVLHVTPYYEHAWAYGGIPRVVAALADTFAARGHHVTVCTTDALANRDRLPRSSPGPGAAWRERSATGVVTEIFPNVSNWLAYEWQLFLPRGLAAYLRKHAREFDIGHIHACHNVPGAIASRALSRSNVPFVLTPNGTAPRIERRRAAKLAFDLLVGRADISRAARIVAVSDAERAQLLALGVPRERIHVGANPLDLSEFDPPVARGAFRRRWQQGDRPIVVFLGKFTPRKRLDVLLHAFATLPKPDARLVVAGNDMGYGETMNRLIRSLGLEGRTILPGLLRGRERLELLADADVVVYPSRDEIFGLVPLEALLCGTPVIVADDSGCGEVVARTGGGLIVPQGDAGALAAAVATILDAPDSWRPNATAAALRVRQLFNAHDICSDLERLYRSILGASA
jgi:glycosyltransferase involved in cell wall biosynthesis